MIRPGVIARGKAIHDIIASTVKLEMKQEYNLNLGEMYGIIDYISELESENEKLRAVVETIYKEGAVPNNLMCRVALGLEAK